MMTEQEMLELEKCWCENCCNFDKEHIQMDGQAKCKLTGTLAYCEESGKDCKCFNVPADNIIVSPCKVGDKVYVICNHEIQETTVFSMKAETEDNKYVFYIHAKAVDGTNRTVDGDYVPYFKTFLFGKTVFLTKEESEQALKGGVQE